MITNLKEGGKTKCERYWPEEGTCDYGPFRVTVSNQLVYPDYTARTLQVSVSAGCVWMCVGVLVVCVCISVWVCVGVLVVCVYKCVGVCRCASGVCVCVWMCVWMWGDL